MKQLKGVPGYLTARKKRLLLYTVLEFSVVFLLLIIGYLTAHSRLNLFTFFAVLSALPASKMLVELIAILPYRTIDSSLSDEIRVKSPLLTSAFDLVITNRDKAMHVDAIVISNRTVFGYASNPKTDTATAAAHIKAILGENRITNTTVKIFSEYIPFLSRAEGLNNIIEVNHAADKELERSIRNIILNISM